jgi:ubiquinone/menaquinone biosynthesis C-methylase UbiE
MKRVIKKYDERTAFVWLRITDKWRDLVKEVMKLKDG